MKRIKIFALSFIALIVLITTNICFSSSIGAMNETNINDSQVSSKLSKYDELTYKTNIPSEWYDETQHHGANWTEYGIGTSGAGIIYHDFVSVDKTTNYANDSYINVSLGSVLEFDAYFAEIDYGQSTPSFSLTISDDNKEGYSLDVTLGSTSIFTNQEQNSLNFCPTYSEADTLSAISPLQYNDGNIIENPDYIPYHFSFAGKAEGVYKITIGTANYLYSGEVSKEYTYAIIVSDPESQVDTGFDSTMLYMTSRTYLISKFNPENDAIYLNTTFSNYFSIYSNSFGNYGTGFAGTNVEAFSTNPNVKIINQAASADEYIYNPGVFKIEAKTSGEYYINIRVNNLFAEQDIADSFETSQDFLVKVVVYNGTEIGVSLNGNEVIDNDTVSSDSIYNISLAIPSYMSEYDNLEVSITIDGILVDNLDGYSFTKGKHTIELKVTDLLYEKASYDYGFSIVTKTITFEAETDVNLYPTINLESSHIVFINLAETNMTSILISNYDLIRKGTIVFDTYGLVAELNDETKTLDIYAETAVSTKITIRLTYNNGIYKEAVLKVFASYGENEVVLSTETLNVNLNNKTPYPLQLGYIINNSFTSLVDNSVYIVYRLYNANILLDEVGLGSYEVTGVSEGTTIIDFSVLVDGILISALHCEVVVSENEGLESSTTFEFEEGANITLLLHSSKIEELTIGGLAASLGYTYTFYSNDLSIASVTSTSPTKATLTPIAVGSCNVYATYIAPNGNTISGVIKVNVIEDIPVVNISLEKNTNVTDLTAFTIYDIIKVSLNTNGFRFTNSAIFLWYLDGEVLSQAVDVNGEVKKVTESDTVIYLKLSEAKIYNLKVVVTDSEYELNVEAEQQINITSVPNTLITLGVDVADQIYAVMDGYDFRINALVDEVTNSDYTFMWGVDDADILKISMSSGYGAIFTPISAGTTTIYVITDIGKYGESRILRKEIKVTVEEFDNIQIVFDNEFYKPGMTSKFDVLINGKRMINTDIEVKVEFSGNEYEASHEDGSFYIESLENGNYTINVNYGAKNISTTFKVSNFNLKQFTMNVLPYLIVASLFLIAIYYLFKKKANAIIVIDKRKTNLEKQFDLVLDKIKGENKKATPKSYYMSIRKKTKALKSSVEYYFDEGIDEYKHVLPIIDSVINILNALIKTTSKTSDYSKCSIALNNIKNNQLKSIVQMLDEIKTTRKKYIENVKRIMSKEEKIELKKTKERLTEEEYRIYLSHSGIIAQDESEDSDE